MLKILAALPNLKLLYLTDTKVTPAGVEAFRKQKPASFVSFGRRPEPIPVKASETKAPAKPKAAEAEEDKP
jgi:hypothetical protein